MIQFFNINDPLRYAYLFIVALVIRTIAMIWIIPVLVPEFQWMLLGEKLADGFMLYSELEDHTAVLSGLVYWMMDELFGRSHLAHMVISSVVIFFQAVLFNLAINKSDLLKEKSYVPALLYIVLTSLYPDFYIVSPVMLGTTFLILTFDRLFQILKHGNSDETAFRLGANLGLAFLFYKPMFLLSGLVLFDLLLYSNTVLRRYLISIFGMVFPLIAVMTFFFWNESLSGFIQLFFVKSFLVKTIYYMSYADVIDVFAIPVGIAIAGLLALLRSTRYIKIQTKSHYCLFHWIVVGVSAAFIFATEFSTFSLFLIIPPIAFFSAAFFLETKRSWLAELYFNAFALFSIVLCFTFNHSTWGGFGLIKPENLVLETENEFKGEKILALTSDNSIYYENDVATAFLNWRVSSRYFKKIDDYNNISTIYSGLKQDMPSIIFDPEGYCESAFSYLPEIRNSYFKKGDYYLLKN